MLMGRCGVSPLEGGGGQATKRSDLLERQGKAFPFSLLISKTVDWSRNSSATVYKISTTEFAYRKYRATA